MTMFTMKPSETRKAAIKYMAAGLVPFIQSSPGLGKSSIMAQIARDYNLELIDLRLSQCAPEDLMGLPMRMGEGKDAKAFFAPFEMFPTENTPFPEGKDGWLLFLDEFNSAPRSVQVAAYKILLDRTVGQAKLHDAVLIAAAGNLSTDRAITNDLSTATQSRLVHIEMAADHREFMNHAAKVGFDHRVLGFLEFQPGLVHNFSPDHTDRTFPCPRTWEFVSRLIKNEPTTEISPSLLAGVVGDGAAVQFHTFMAEYDNLPTYEKILKDGDTMKVPAQASTCFATVTMMLDRFTQDTFEKAVIYARRFSPEFQVVYFRGIVAKHPAMRRDPTYTRNITHLVKFLNDTSDETAQAA